MKFLIMILPLVILSACQTISKPEYREKQCFVNFLTPAAEETYNKAKGMTTKERREKDLVVNPLTINAWFIRRADETKYVVYKMDWELDENHPEVIAANNFIASVRKTLTLSERDEQELFRIYKESGKNVSHKKFEQDVKTLKMTPTKCEDLERSRGY